MAKDEEHPRLIVVQGI